MLNELGLAVRLGAAAVVMAVLGYVAHRLHHAGYVEGQAERTAYYAPLMQRADEALVAANAKVDRLNLAALAITNNVEKEHADDERALADRATAAELRIAQLLRQRAAGRAAGGGQVPGVSGSTDPPGATGRGDGRDGALAAGVSAVGARCERDASRLDEWIEWYHQQRANALTNLRN